MACGASFADLAVILVDATQGVLTQTRRHARICALMGIRYFVFAINKMDLVGYSEQRFKEIEAQIAELQQELHLHDVKLIPVSATEGDNVMKKSPNMAWYDGPTLLDYLEQVDVSAVQEEGFYMPVQRVCRPNHEFRGFQGQIESGSIAVGDTVTSQPSGEEAQVKKILVADREAESAFKGQPVTIQLNREVDVSRGCVLEKGSHVRQAANFKAEILWMDDVPLTIGKNFMVFLGTKKIPGILTKIDYRIDINTGEHVEATGLKKNEIAVCEIAVTEPHVRPSPHAGRAHPHRPHQQHDGGLRRRARNPRRIGQAPLRSQPADAQRTQLAGPTGNRLRAREGWRRACDHRGG